MPEVEYAMGLSAHESGTVYHVSLVLKNRIDNVWVFVGIIFQVGILNNQDIAAGGSDTGSQGGAFTGILAMVKHFVDLAGKLGFNDLSRSIGGIIIDNDNFFVSKGRSSDSRDDCFNRVFFVITGNDNG